MSGIILTGISHNTLFGAGGSCCYNTLIIVTGSRDFSLLFKCLLTYRALLTIGKTCLKTGCSLACYGLLGMTESFGHIACASFTTNGTGVCCVTAIFTGGKSYGCALLMTERRCFVSGVGLITTGTCIGGVTALQAIGLGYYCIIAMVYLGKLVVCGVITSGALYVCIPTDSSTSGSLCLVRGLAMA